MITLYLRGEVQGSREALEQFLERARPVYEALDGVRVRLQWDLMEPNRFLEIIEYPDQETLDADQLRVEHDPQMGELLKEWRSLLADRAELQIAREAELGKLA